MKISTDSFLVVFDDLRGYYRIKYGGTFFDMPEISVMLNSALALYNCAQGTENEHRPVIKHLPGCSVCFDLDCDCGFLYAMKTLRMFFDSMPDEGEK